MPEVPRKDGPFARRAAALRAVTLARICRVEGGYAHPNLSRRAQARLSRIWPLWARTQKRHGFVHARVTVAT